MKRVAHSTYRGPAHGLVLIATILAFAASFPAAATEIYVISNGWHTGLVLARGDVPAGRIPEIADFPDAAYLEFGWGDREYYPNPRKTLGMALGAALVPSPAVVHMAGLARPPSEAHPGMDVLAVPLADDGLARVVAALDASFERPAEGPARAIAPGLYGDSLFYPARGSFHLFNTCNTWVAEVLAGAGVAVSPAGVVTADDLMNRLRGLPDAARREPKG